MDLVFHGVSPGTGHDGDFRVRNFFFKICLDAVRDPLDVSERFDGVKTKKYLNKNLTSGIAGTNAV